MVKINCCNENQQYIVVMLSKFVGKLFKKELIQKINNSTVYFLMISIDHDTNNVLMIYNANIIFPFSRYNELKFIF